MSAPDFGAGVLVLIIDGSPAATAIVTRLQLRLDVPPPIACGAVDDAAIGRRVEARVQFDAVPAAAFGAPLFATAARRRDAQWKRETRARRWP